MFCRSYINLVIRFSRRSSISILCVVLCYLLVHFINYIAAVAKLFFNTIKIYREYIINKGTKKKIRTAITEIYYAGKGVTKCTTIYSNKR